MWDPWPDTSIHVEWGEAGARLAAARGDLVVIVDVLSFSTSVVEVVSRGAALFCFSPDAIEDGGGREAVGRRLNARMIEKSRETMPGQISLSPASLQELEAGERVVLTSLNRGRCTGVASDGAPVVIVGALTNRRAVADCIAGHLGSGTATRCTIVSCAELWSSSFMATAANSSYVVDSDEAGRPELRPSFEDLLGAGAIVDALPPRLERSVEAEMAAATFSAAMRPDGQPSLASRLRRSVSGRELLVRGYESDVEIAARLDRHSVVPEWHRGDEPGLFASRT